MDVVVFVVAAGVVVVSNAKDILVIETIMVEVVVVCFRIHLPIDVSRRANSLINRFPG